MVESKLDSNSDIERWLTGSSSSASESIGIQRPNMEIYAHAKQIFEDRHKQKEIVLWFIIILTIAITVFSMGVIFVVMFFKATYGLDLLSETTLNVLGGSFFIELIAVIHSIAKALWDESGSSVPIFNILKN